MARPEVSFHTAGNRLPHDGSYIIVNQAYVQYVPPVFTNDTQSSSISTSIPILFVHGGGLTGAMWESTPDRRPGWAVLASRPPYSRPVYCIDDVDSGRSQSCPDTFRPSVVEYRTAADMWWRFRFGPPDDFDHNLATANAQSQVEDESQRKAFSDLQFPLEHSDRLLASQSARRRGAEQCEAEAQALRDAFAEIGKCDVVAHSNGCAISVLATLDESTKSKVRRLVMVEPGPPHIQSLEHLNSVRTLVVWGDHLSGHKLWEQIVDHYAEMSGDVTVLDLPGMDIRGNSHFPMLDGNSDRIGGMVLDWLRTT